LKKLLFLLIFAIATDGFSQMLGTQGQWLHRAIPDSKIEHVWNGDNLPSGFNGEGVIIGFTDWGFDYTHPVFFDTLMQEYRVARAWDQWCGQGKPPTGFNYGTELVGKEALLTAMHDTNNVYDLAYHGTHVASIAGGAGAGTAYKGVAYNAQLLFTSILVDEKAIMDAFRWMHRVAKEEGKHLIISMSWGLYYMGNMDGTGAIASLMDSLSKEGVLFVAAAGNCGYYRFHLHRNFNEYADTLRSRIHYAGDNAGNQWGQSISMLNTPGHDFAFALQIMNNQKEQIAQSPWQNVKDSNSYAEGEISLPSGDTVYYKVNLEHENPYNHRPQARLCVKKMTTNNYFPVLAVTAKGGDFHAWNVIELPTGVGNWGGDFSSEDIPEWQDGDYQYGIGTPANVEVAVTVAAHQSRYQVGNYDYGGDIATFSSYGPVPGQPQKPDLSAPGYEITAALSSYTNQSYSGTRKSRVTFNGRNYYFLSLSGTSMAAPLVSGVAALMWQANPALSPAQIKQILRETASNDDFTLAAGIERFGQGKINAWQAVIKALNTTGIQPVKTSTTTLSLYPNPASRTLYLSLRLKNDHAKVFIYNITGQTVLQQDVFTGSNAMNVANLPNGFYVLKLVDNQEIIVKKFIKKTF
jgi:subtilisin family serine protease